MLRIVPIGFAPACAFVTQLHRHHRAPQGHKFSVAVANEEKIVGVAIVGRPVCRRLQDGFTLEVTRICTDGTKNACSMLYGACFRIAKEMGYRKLITYILDSESGTSLKAAGWLRTAVTRGGSWNCKKRPRNDQHPTCPKIRFEKTTEK